MGVPLTTPKVLGVQRAGQIKRRNIIPPNPGIIQSGNFFFTSCLITLQRKWILLIPINAEQEEGSC